MDGKKWNQIVNQIPDPHILQTWEWGKVKSWAGWKPFFKVWGDPENPDAAALILERSIGLNGIGLGVRIQYVPKGPLLRDWSDISLVQTILDDLRRIAQERKTIFIKIDPDVCLGTGIPGATDEVVNQVGSFISNYLESDGWIFSEDQIQFRNTVMVDLEPSEDEILAKMKQKTRYNIRLARRRGVSVRPGSMEDFRLLYKMYSETSIRDGFIIREADYYYQLWNTFMNPTRDHRGTFDHPICEPLIAEINGEAVAGVVIFRFAKKAYYMHGMSLPIHRSKMPNYLLQWEAMIRAKAAGCITYDLWGAPEVFSKHDPMWGVYRFKEGFGGKVVRTIGAYDWPRSAFMYQLYTQTLPKILEGLRRMGRSRVERELPKLDKDGMER